MSSDDEVSDGYEGYVEDTVDPGIWLLVATCIFCFGVMLVFVPLLLFIHNRKRQAAKRRGEVDQTSPIIDGQEKPKVDATLKNILGFDRENRKILKLAIPYSISGLSSSILSNCSLVIVSQYIGIKSLAAYSVAGLLLSTPNEIASCAIYACTTLCAQSVGAGNNKMAGNYIQFSLILYLVLNIPVLFFWWSYMYEVILYLEWGDEETAMLGQRYTRTYMWGMIVEGISSAIWELFEVTDHSVAGTIATILWGIASVVGVGLMVAFVEEPKIEYVGLVSTVVSILAVLATYVYANSRGWLRPFNEGLFRSVSFRSPTVVKNMMKQAVPLAVGSLLSNAEWTVLTFFASHLGSAEVAAWAIMGSLWDVFYATTSGIGDAAEIRVAFHLGDGHPTMARLSAYKSLFIGMMVSICVSIVYFSLQDYVSLETLLMPMSPSLTAHHVFRSSQH